jgi:hypothetical protein
MTVVKVNRKIPQSAFKDQKTITSVFFGTECSSVGVDAFNGCISLSKINNDNGIIEIEGGTFASTSLSTVKLNKLNKIKSNEYKNGYGAFQGCSILTSIDIQQCSNIGNNAFYSCTNLKTVNINSKFNSKSSYVQIGNNAFYNCSSLSDINLKACILIGSNAFYNCGQLSKANLENCEYMYSGAFINCSSLKEITLSNSKNIDDRVFYNCSKLSIVYVNTQDVIPLGSSVFYSGASIIENIKFYMQPGAISKFTEDKEYGSNWSKYLNHMIETPNSNQIIYTTNDGNQINVNMGGVEHVVEHVFENDFGKIKFKDEVVKQLPESKIFKGKENLTSIYSPFKLETVGEQEFEGCINLDKFIPPQANTLTTIGDYAFKNCTSLKSFEIPESVTSIGEGVFAGCSNIEKFEGNEKYVKYNNKAIVYNNILISVAQKDKSKTGGRYYKISEIDHNIKSLGKSCFHGFNELMRVDIPCNIEIIEENASEGYDNLQEDNIERIKIGENAFEGCDNLQEVHFYGNVDLSKIDFGKNAFGIFVDENESEIKKGREDFKIFIPERIFKNINFESEEIAFIKKYEKYIYPEPAEKQIIYYLNNSKDSDSDTNNKNYKTTKFYNNLSFEGNTKISKVIFGEKITKINDFTFKNCTSLEYICLPDTITTFGNECFYGCSHLKRICIPNKPNNFYSKQENIKDPIIDSIMPMSDVEIENNLLLNNKFGITSFGDNLFYGCVSLMKFDSYYKNFVSEDGRCYIDGGTLMFFAQCGLDEGKTYEMSNNINKINKSAFKGTNIQDIVISSNVSIISESAFEGCSNLQSITFNNVSNISKCAFKDCKNLKGISLPPNLKTIGESAFESCEEMYICTNLSNVEKIGNQAFMNCKKFKYVNNNDKPLNLSNIISIGDYAFSGCADLSTKLFLPSTLTSIGKCCFQQAGIKELDMSNADKINIIRYNTFYGCTNLTNVKLPDSIEYIEFCAFKGCNIKEIYLPLNLSKIGNFSFATNGSINIYINKNTEIPPKFVYTSGSEDRSVSVMPFGENPNLNIFAPTSELCETYKNDKHWKKYAKYISNIK